MFCVAAPWSVKIGASCASCASWAIDAQFVAASCMNEFVEMAKSKRCYFNDGNAVEGGIAAAPCFYQSQKQSRQSLGSDGEKIEDGCGWLLGSLIRNPTKPSHTSNSRLPIFQGG
jgi:hypothetical protein